MIWTYALPEPRVVCLEDDENHCRRYLRRLVNQAWEIASRKNDGKERSQGCLKYSALAVALQDALELLLRIGGTAAIKRKAYDQSTLDQFGFSGKRRQSAKGRHAHQKPRDMDHQITLNGFGFTMTTCKMRYRTKRGTYRKRRTPATLLSMHRYRQTQLEYYGLDMETRRLHLADRMLTDYYKHGLHLFSNSNPAFLTICREAYHVMARQYPLMFAGPRAPAHVRFHSDKDTLYVPQHDLLSLLADLDLTLPGYTAGDMPPDINQNLHCSHISHLTRKDRHQVKFLAFELGMCPGRNGTSEIRDAGRQVARIREYFPSVEIIHVIVGDRCIHDGRSECTTIDAPLAMLYQNKNVPSDTQAFYLSYRAAMELENQAKWNCTSHDRGLQLWRLGEVVKRESRLLRESAQHGRGTAQCRTNCTPETRLSMLVPLDVAKNLRRMELEQGWGLFEHNNV